MFSSLAKWSMVSQRNALIVIVACSVIPLLFWLSAAVAALLVLRHGAKDALSTILWGALPGIAWLAMGDATPLLTLIGASSLAVILRSTVDLKITIMSAVALGLVFYWLFPLLMPEVISLVQMRSDDFFSKMLENEPELLAIYKPLIHSLMLGVLSMISALSSVLSLLLARWWQSSFYNPGGYQQEFHSLKLPPAYALMVAVLLAFGAEISQQIVGLIPIITMPLMVTGVAFVHGIIGIKKLGAQWLVIFYITAFLFGPYLFTLLIFVALIDSFIDLRSRLTPVMVVDDNESDKDD